LIAEEPVAFHLLAKFKELDGFGVGLETTTPLFHTSFLPLFTHTYFLPLAVAVMPNFLHASPDLIAEWLGGEDKNNIKNENTKILERNLFFISNHALRIFGKRS
jgi:hypothetical protein